MIKCKACNYDNPIGRVHCMQCGAKIDLSMVVTEDQATGAKGEVVVKVQKAGAAASIGRTIRKIISLAILAMLAVVGLLVWQQMPAEDVPMSAAFALAAKGRVDTLAQAQERGTPLTITFNNQEINSYLNDPASPQHVKFTPDNPAAVFLPRWSKYQIELGSGRFTALAVAEVRIKSFSKQFIFRSSGSFVDSADGRRVKWSTAFIGRLPLHALPGGDVAAQIFGSLCFKFEGFDAEWKLLKEARAVALTPGNAVVCVGAAR
ncbi:MAG: hypothetical protein NT105_12165 [Verrucomicrobia bacterium]|nr:hypothetical protein [Verrucomicrobiota bacterium]